MSRLKLEKLEDWITDDQRCLDKAPNFNSTTQLCLGGREHGGQGACHGDSGASFQCRGTDHKFYQVKLCITCIMIN